MRGVNQIFFLIVACTTIAVVNSGNVLVLLAQASKSHKNVFEPIISGLAERNHTITVVSPFAGKPRKNVREIVPNNMGTTLNAHFGNPFEMRKKGTMGMLANFQFIWDACHDTYKNSEFRALEHEKFDLVLIDAFMNECLFGWLHKMQVPFIMVSPLAAPGSITQAVGNRLPPSFVPVSLMPYSDHMTLLERTKNVGFILLFDLLTKFYFENKYESIYRQHVSEDLPGPFEIIQNASMIFMNSHFTFTFPRPLLPDIVEVGGMHCRPAKALPKDLDKFVSEAKDGLILFSLGSIIQGKDMPDEMRQKFLNVFSRLKQRVLWKWETEDMHGLPPNVKLSKWVPQQDVLGHPNTKLFITHGGLLSTQEATYHGVPLLGIPIFGDQDLNMQQAERAGYALSVEILELTEEGLEKTIKEILTDKKYADRAKQLSSVFRDQTETPLERAVFWSEYVMRHRGAIHMRSAARNLNFIQYYCLDVLAVLAGVLALLLWVVKVILVKLVPLILPKESESRKKND